MESLIKQIVDLPVIIQGALGSFLFWFLYTLSIKLLTLFTSLLGRMDQRVCEYGKHLELLKIGANEFKEPRKSYCRNVLFGMAAADTIKALIYITFGLIFSSVVDIFGVIGYLIGLFFLFRAFSTIQPRKSDKELVRKFFDNSNSE